MITAVDLFCGAGGTSTGIIKAAVERLRRKITLVAVNHWRTAVNSHQLNHPEVRHLCENVENVHPLELVPSGVLTLLAASVECRFHSNARGGGPCNEQSRSQAWQIPRWAADIRVENILMENVQEFQHWGPISPSRKRPIKSRRGEFFRSFVQTLSNMGYTVEWRVQVAADYGDPTSRRRLILMARLGKPIVWPEPSHGPGRETPWRTARECIDWDLKGTSIFNRKKPLCANTLRRISAGLRKFGGTAAQPFLVILNGTTDGHIDASARSLEDPMPAVVASGNHLTLCEPFVIGQQSGAAPRDVNSPLPTIATAGAIRLVEPFLMKYHAGNRRLARVHSVDEPLRTQDTSNRFAVVEPIIVTTDQTGGGDNPCYARSVDSPLGTVVSKQNMLLVEPLVLKYYKSGICKPVDAPLDTITTKARFMLVECDSGREVAELDIRTRMLQPHELAACHSFPKTYRFTGNKEAQTKQIGNSVPVELAAAHAASILS